MEIIEELLDEIQAICIGADSPDAIEHGGKDPIEELQYCRTNTRTIKTNNKTTKTKLKE